MQKLVYISLFRSAQHSAWIFLINKIQSNRLGRISKQNFWTWTNNSEKTITLNMRKSQKCTIGSCMRGTLPRHSVFRPHWNIALELCAFHPFFRFNAECLFGILKPGDYHRFIFLDNDSPFPREQIIAFARWKLDDWEYRAFVYNAKLFAPRVCYYDWFNYRGSRN